MPIMTQREYARQKGWNPGYVSKLIAKGVILVVDDKRRIDSEQADAAIDAARDPQKDYMREVNQRQRMDSGRSPADGDNSSHPSKNTTYHQAKAATQVFEARLKELEYKTRLGKVVSLDDVVRAGRDIGAAFAAALDRMPDRIAPALAAETDANRIYEILQEEMTSLRTEIRHALSGMVEALSESKQ